MNVDKAYRYEDQLYSDGVDQFGDPLPTSHIKVNLYKYDILSRTEKGIWIRYWNAKCKKFILLSAKKKYACLTKEEALESFKARKKRQIRILTSQLNNAKESLNIAKGNSLLQSLNIV